MVWDMERYKFFLEGKDFASIHPSLQRQSDAEHELRPVRGHAGLLPGARLRSGQHHLRQGRDRLDRVRPADRGGDRRAPRKKLVDEHLGELPVVAVVYSHSHGDHWGGVRGIVDEADVRAGKVQIIAPRDFMQHAISENVYAGNAMNRRLFYQYGVLLPASPFGHAGQGLAQNVADGNIGLIPPTHVIEEDIEELTVDGVKMVFQNTPGTEAPSEMNTWFPDEEGVLDRRRTSPAPSTTSTRCAAPRCATHCAGPSTSTRRSTAIGKEAEVMFASHHWPRWGNERIQEVLRGQRDLYANINNQVLHLANQGVTINQIHNVYETPKGIADQWYNRGYHGSPEHNSRGGDQPLPRLLGRQPGHPDPAVTGRLRTAVRGDDGRRQEDHGQGQGAA